MRDALLNIAGISICPDLVKKGVTKLLGEPKPMDLLSFLKAMGDNFESFSHIVNAWFEGVPFSQLLVASEPYSELISKIYRLLMYEDKLYTGLRTPGMMDARQFSKVAHEYLRMAKLFAPRIKKGTSQHNTMKTLIIKLENAINIAQRLIGSKSRVAPLAMVVHGVPGIGKSKIVGHLLRTHCAVKGREWSDDYSYTRVKTSDYWEGYIPEAHPYVLYSELGSKSLQQVKTKGDDIIEEMTSLVDDLPFPCDMAFGQKGSVFANPELVVVDTNNENMNLEVLVANPAAYFRRFIYVHVRVKSEYLKEGTNMLDTEKSFNDTHTDIMDRWYFDVYKREAVDNKQFNRIDILSNGNIYDFTKVMAQLYTSQISKMHAIKANLQTNYDMTNYLGKDFIPDEREIRERIAILKEAPELSQKETDELTKWEKIVQEISDEYRAEFTKAIQDEEVSIDSDTEFFSRMDSPIETESCNSTTVRTAVNAVTPLARLGYYYWSFWNARDYVKISYPEYYYSLTVMLSGAAMVGMYAMSKFGRSKWSLSALILILVGLYLRFGSLTAFICFQLVIGFLYVSDVSPMKLILIKSYLETSYEDSKTLSSMHWGLSEDVCATPLPQSSAAKYAIAACVACGAVCSALALYWSLSTKNSAASEGAVKLSVNLRDIETRVGAKPPIDRVAVKNTTVWNTVDYPQVSQQSENTLENVLNKVKRNIRDCNIHVYAQTHHTHVLGLFGNVVAVNTHVLYSINPETGVREIPKTFSISMAPPGMAVAEAISFKTTIVSRVEHVSQDITLCEVDSVQFKDLRPYLFDGDIPTNVGYDINGNKTPIVTGISFTADTTSHPIHYENAIHYKFVDHRKGDCGTPLLVAHGKGYAIAGIHCAGSPQRDDSYAVRMEKKNIKWDFTLIPIYSEKGCLPTTQLPDEKSPFRYEVLHNLHFKGQIPGVVTLPKQSEVRLNPTCEVYSKILGESIFDERGIERFGAPVMRPRTTVFGYVSPYNLALRNLNCERVALDPSRVERIIEKMFIRFSSATTSLSPLTFETALNGASNDAYLRSMNLSTSAGYGFPGKKREYVLIDESGRRIPKEYLQERVESVIAGYLDETSGDCIYQAALKDETRSRKKIDAGDTRLFYVGPFAHLLVDRMFLAPLFTLMQEKSEIFGTAIGFNMHSAADNMVKRLLAKGSRFFELDYKKYDLKMPFGIKRAVHTLIIRLLKHWGYNDEALKIVTGILNDNTFINIVILKALFSISGNTPSGMYATAEKNSLFGIFNLMYAFDIIYPMRDFFESVVVYVYGDDVFGTVGDDLDDFNNVTVSTILLEHMGLECTPATKDSEFTKFLSINEVSFLKRNFVYREDLQRWVAPLSAESLLKMGSYYIPSRVVDKYTQDCDTATSFLYEWYLHCAPAVWDQSRRDMANCLANLHGIPVELILKRFPTREKLEQNMFTS